MILNIPLTGTQEIFTVTINAIIYTFTFRWANQEDFGWFLNIGDSLNDPIIMGIPLTTGNDLLQQFKHILPFQLYLHSGITELAPGLNGLGRDITLRCEF